MNSGPSLKDFAAQLNREIGVERVFEHCHPEKYKGPGRNAHCHAHEDKNPSAGFKNNRMTCFAGCSPPGRDKPHWSAIDLWMNRYSEDFPTATVSLARHFGIPIPAGLMTGNGDRKKTTPARSTESYRIDDAQFVWPYPDEQARILYQVGRFKDNMSGKVIRPFSPDGNGGWKLGLDGVRRVPYNLPEILTSSLDTHILIFEGEKCADCASKLGFVATTNVSGAKKWKGQAEQFGINEHFRGRKVVIFADNDPPGHEHGEQVRDCLSGIAAEIRIVDLPDLPTKGDIVDFVNQHGPEAATRMIRELIESAVPYQPERKASSTTPQIVSFADVQAMDLPEPRWIVRDLLPEGLCVLAGAPKIGKSWLAQHLSISVASGTLALGQFPCEQGDVLHLALEDNLRRFRKRMLMMLGNKPGPDRGFFASEWPCFSDAKDEVDGLELIRLWLEDHRDSARMIIIDTFAKIRPRKSKNKDDIYARDYKDLEGLQALAAKYSIAAVVIHHQNKGQHVDQYNTISGSTGITGAADTVAILTKADRSEGDGILFISGRDIEERKGALQFDRNTGLWRWLGDSAELKMTDERRQIRDIMQGTGRPMKPAEIAELCEPKKAAKAVQKTLSRMIEAGEAGRASGQFGKYVLPPEDHNYGQPVHSRERSRGHETVQQDSYLDHI